MKFRLWPRCCVSQALESNQISCIPEESKHQVQIWLQKSLHLCLGTHMLVRVTVLRWWSASPPETAAQPCLRTGSHLDTTGLSYKSVEIWKSGPRLLPLCCSFPCHRSQDFQLPKPQLSHNKLQDLAAPVTPPCSWCASSTGWALHPQSNFKSRTQREMKLLIQGYSLWACPEVINRKTLLKLFGMLQHDWSAQPQGFLVTEQQMMLQMMT